MFTHDTTTHASKALLALIVLAGGCSAGVASAQDAVTSEVNPSSAPLRASVPPR